MVIEMRWADIARFEITAYVLDSDLKGGEGDLCIYITSNLSQSSMCRNLVPQNWYHAMHRMTRSARC
ncbi:Uncharacterized protein HZ326_3131 [Fusarium oxysporum f. sp. albedinis]|nr:Uncharacterized protein HZ326_3131 [Fusarium oxysporum f. sp. albedinis]